MAVRTTVNSVSGIIEVDDTITLTPFIEAASALVDEHCATALDEDGNAYYTATQLELIERWLSAHFYAIRDPRAMMGRAGSVSAQYQSRVDLGFDVTHYGQMAMRLDSYGGLAAVNENSKKGLKPVVGVNWIGSTPTEIQSYNLE